VLFLHNRDIAVWPILPAASVKVRGEAVSHCHPNREHAKLPLPPEPLKRYESEAFTIGKWAHWGFAPRLSARSSIFNMVPSANSRRLDQNMPL
jgi:hypothetical protein